MQQCLVGPEPTEVEWGLQLGLVEADHLGSIVLQEIIDDLLFGLSIKTPNIEGDECELLQFSSHSGEITFNVGSLMDGAHAPVLTMLLGSILFGDMLFCFFWDLDTTTLISFFFLLLFPFVLGVF